MALAPLDLLYEFVETVCDLIAVAESTTAIAANPPKIISLHQTFMMYSLR
jgi:hypothetical protein